MIQGQTKNSRKSLLYACILLDIYKGFDLNVDGMTNLIAAFDQGLFSHDLDSYSTEIE